MELALFCIAFLLLIKVLLLAVYLPYLSKIHDQIKNLDVEIEVNRNSKMEIEIKKEKTNKE